MCGTVKLDFSLHICNEGGDLYSFYSFFSTARVHTLAAITKKVALCNVQSYFESEKV